MRASSTLCGKKLRPRVLEAAFFRSPDRGASYGDDDGFSHRVLSFLVSQRLVVDEHVLDAVLGLGFSQE